MHSWCRLCQTPMSCLQGVQQLHKLGRSHNDLKPDNILVCNFTKMDNLQVVIIDIAGSMPVGSCEFNCKAAPVSICMSVDPFCTYAA